MRKYDILSKSCGLIADPIAGAFHDEQHDITPIECYKAMDEYAKELAIDFANWTKQSKYCVNSMEEWFSYDTDEKPTTEQLFEKFKQETAVKNHT